VLALARRSAGFCDQTDAAGAPVVLLHLLLASPETGTWLVPFMLHL
jgi:hypothetical protein